MLNRGPDDSSAVITQLVQMWRSSSRRKGRHAASVRQPASSETGNTGRANARTRRRRAQAADVQQEQSQSLVASNIAMVAPQQAQGPLTPATNVTMQHSQSIAPIGIATHSLPQSHIPQAVLPGITVSQQATEVASGSKMHRSMAVSGNAQQNTTELPAFANMVQSLTRNASSSAVTMQTRTQRASGPLFPSGGEQCSTTAQVQTFLHGMQQAIQRQTSVPTQPQFQVCIQTSSNVFLMVHPFRNGSINDLNILYPIDERKEGISFLSFFEFGNFCGFCHRFSYVFRHFFTSIMWTGMMRFLKIVSCA